MVWRPWGRDTTIIRENNMSRRLLTFVGLAILGTSMLNAEDQARPQSPWFQRRADKLEALIVQDGADSITKIGGSYYDDRSLVVAGKLPNLERVSCLCHGYVTDKGLKHLRGKQELTHLYIRGDFTDEGLKMLSTLPKLERVNLNSEHVTDETAKALASIKTLRYIRLSKTQITDEAIAELRRSLPDCQISHSK